MRWYFALALLALAAGLAGSVLLPSDVYILITPGPAAAALGLLVGVVLAAGGLRAARHAR